MAMCDASELNLGDVVVLGLGKTGEAVADCLLDNGHGGRARSVTVYGGLKSESGESTRALEAAGARVVCGTEDIEGHYDLAVVSPGISEFSDFFASAAAHADEVIGEPELAWRESPERWVGITGTNGKTTSTYLLKHILEQTLGAKVGLIGSISNMIGDEEFHAEHTTPESCDLQALFRQMADAGCTHCVMEVSSHSLVLRRVAGVHFAVGLFTNLTQDHLDFHNTMEEYAKAKAMLFPMCEKTAANADDPWTETVMKDAPQPVYTFSAKSDSASLTARDIRLAPSGVRFCALEEGDLVRVKTNLPGQFSVYNALAAISCARLLGVSLADAAAALETAHGAKGRVEPVPTDGDYSIFIDYAVTPDAIENVLTTLRGIAPKRLVMLFGAGGDSANMPTTVLADADFENGGINILSLLVATGLCPSRGEARRLVQQGGIVVDEKKVESIDESIPQEKFAGDGIIIRKGKKVFHKAVTR